MRGNRNGLLIVSAVLAVAVVASPLAGVAAADHGSPANFTVYPESLEDRSPATTDGTYVMSSAGADAFESDRGLEYVDYYWIESDQASFTACDPDNARTFGIDRGNNNSGTQTDVDLLEHMKNYAVEDRRITLELYDEGDFGGDPVNLNAPDATVAVLAGCVENTGDAGWYQFQGFVNGTTYDGGYEEVYLDSHYFWIGDFESEAAAREELGPPPSEDGEDDAADADDESTPTPTTPTDGGGDEDDGESTQDTATPEHDGGGDEDDGESTQDTATPEHDGGDDAGAGDTGTDEKEGDDREAASTGSSTDGDAGDDRDVQSTPTPGDGAGFGVLVAVVSLLAATHLAGRR